MRPDCVAWNFADLSAGFCLRLGCAPMGMAGHGEKGRARNTHAIDSPPFLLPVRCALIRESMSMREPYKPLMLLAVLALALGLWLGSRRVRHANPPTPPTTEPNAAALRSSSGSSAGAAHERSPAATAPQEQLPQPPCWADVFQLDETASLESLRQALQAALAANDPLFLQYLEDRLSEVIGGDGSRALTILSWAEAAGPPLSTHLLSALKQAKAVQEPQVADKLVALGSDASLPLDARRAALDALETQHSLPADRLQRLKNIAMDQTSDEAAWVATRTMGRVMTEEFKRSGSSGAYLQELIDIGQHSSEAAVRSLALEMASYADIPVERASFSSLSKILTTDPDRQVREMAAFRLGLSRDPKSAQSALAAAFSGESDLCVRWAIFRFAVRASGAKALPLLDKLSRIEPRLRPDYDDFVAIYGRGVVDFARVWQEKPERIQCGEDGE